MRLGRWIIAGVVVACAAGGAWLYLGRGDGEQTFATTPARRGSIAALVAATGTVSPVITVTVGSQISGQVQSLNADFNSIVHKGQVIATLDPSNLNAQVSRDRANVSSALAGLEKAKVEADNAARAFERAKNLNKQSLLAQSDYDAAELLAASTSASVKTAQAAIEEARASLQISEVNLGHATIVSPVDGIVISRDVDVGQTVAASLQAPTLFTIAQDLRRMEVHMNVAESDIGRLAIGQESSFTVDAYPQERFRGKIFAIRNSPTTIQNVVTYEAVIEVDNSDLRLKPGMTANVSVTVAKKENVLLVPNAALRFKPPSDLLARADKQSAAATKQAAADPPQSGASSGAGGADGAASADGQGSAAGRGRRNRAGGSPGSDGPAGAGSTDGAGARAGATPAAPGSGEGRSSASKGAWQPGAGRGGRPGPTVWILTDSNPRRATIAVGITDGAWTEVVSGDIKEGDPVITELTGAAALAATRTTRPGLGRMF
jgi:HlyD family secretion protein